MLRLFFGMWQTACPLPRPQAAMQFLSDLKKAAKGEREEEAGQQKVVLIVLFCRKFSG